MTPADRQRIRDLVKLANEIADYARMNNLDVTPEKVLRHMKWFERWYFGGLSTGYLINRLGLRKLNANR